MRYVFTQLALDLNLLALETKLLLQIYLTQVALILTQVDSNPTQVEWNLAQVDLKMVLEVPEQFSSLLALCFHSTCVGNKATLANIPNASDLDSNTSRLKFNTS